MQIMIYQYRSNTLEKQTEPKQTAKASINTKGIVKKTFLDITALVRSIQRAEGNFDCFRKGQGYCDNVDCAWRIYCLESN